MVWLVLIEVVHHNPHKELQNNVHSKKYIRMHVDGEKLWYVQIAIKQITTFFVTFLAYPGCLICGIS